LADRSESNQSKKAIKVAIEGAMDQGAMIGAMEDHTMDQGVRDESRTIAMDQGARAIK